MSGKAGGILDGGGGDSLWTPAEKLSHYDTRSDKYENLVIIQHNKFKTVQ